MLFTVLIVKPLYLEAVVKRFGLRLECSEKPSGVCLGLETAKPGSLTVPVWG